jgi:ribosomal protein S18 acetylase RimI-like enzyme
MLPMVMQPTRRSQMPVDASAVGSRVVVRSRLGGHGPGGGPAMTDVVGILVAADPDRLTVRRRDGTLVDVRVGDVVTAKEVSGLPGGRPGTGLRIDAEDLQRVTDTGWPAPVSQPLGEWLLRAASGFTGRANSVSVHGSPARPFDRALADITSFYASHGLPPMAQVVVGSAWESEFAGAGWSIKPGSHAGALVQVAGVRTALRSAGGPVPDAVRLARRVSDDWLNLYNRAGGDVDPEVVRGVLEGPQGVVLARLGDPAVAIGRLVVDGDWAGMAAVEVAPEHRGRGLARQVVDALLRAADAAGARWCYLQTMEHNTAALRLYAGYGFTTHHRYRYLVRGG